MSGNIVLAHDDELTCIECDQRMEIGNDGSPGVSHHVDEDGRIDHDADADHVAIAEQAVLPSRAARRER